MTSKSSNYSSNSVISLAPSGTVNNIPFPSQEDEYRTFLPYASNPGLTGGSTGINAYVWQYASDIHDPLSNIEFALDINSLSYFVRRCLTINPPAQPTWTNWSPISGGGGPPLASVVSWTGMQGTTRSGAVLAINGDYTASSITATPTGVSWPPADTNVQLALNDLYASLADPYANAEHINFTVPTGAWTSAAIVYAPGNSRPAAAWAPAVDGIQDIRPSSTFRNVIVVSATVVVTGPITGTIGIRVLKNGFPNVVCQSISPDDGLGTDLTVTSAAIIIDNTTDVFTLEILNNTLTNPVTVTRSELNLINKGAV
jgi:hypothetical protein